jgi:hypothetical protein
MTVALAMAAVLLWAGLEKARDLGPTTSTMRSLGVPLRQARLAAWLLAFTEVGVAFGLVFMPELVWTQIGVVTLTFAFALAGVIALRQDEPIRCNCFGSGANGHLGRNQIVALLPWLAGAGVLHLSLSEPLLLSAGAMRLSALGLTLATWRAIAVWRARYVARGDRLSAMEMYLWPR